MYAASFNASILKFEFVLK